MIIKCITYPSNSDINELTSMGIIQYLYLIEDYETWIEKNELEDEIDITITNDAHPDDTLKTLTISVEFKTEAAQAQFVLAHGNLKRSPAEVWGEMTTLGRMHSTKPGYYVQ